MTATASISSRDDARLGQRRLDHRRDQLEVMARGHLGHDAAELRVRGGLRGDHVGEHARRRPAPPRRCRRRRSRGRGCAYRSHGSVEPHDQRVLAVVLVVARTHSGRAEAEPLVHRDRRLVGDPHLEREGQACRLPPRPAWRSGRGRCRRGGAPGRRRRSSGARPGRSASRPGSRPARHPPSPPGRSPTAWRARARTSPATRASGRSAARSRSPRAGRCRRAAGSRRRRRCLTRLSGKCLAHAIAAHREVSGRSGRGDRRPRSRRPPRGHRRAARRPGARGRRRRECRRPDSPALGEIVPPPIRPPAGRGQSRRARSASTCGGATNGSQSRSPAGE